MDFGLISNLSRMSWYRLRLTLVLELLDDEAGVDSGDSKENTKDMIVLKIFHKSFTDPPTTDQMTLVSAFSFTAADGSAVFLLFRGVLATLFRFFFRFAFGVAVVFPASLVAPQRHEVNRV